MTTPGWVHSFSVSDSQLFGGKFTIYRITSVIFPVENPGALSCVTAWKRYSDVRALHQKLSKRAKQGKVKLPPLRKDRSQYFQRFNADVIEGRKKAILELLEFIGGQPSLYSSDVFTKFLQHGYVPPSPGKEKTKIHIDLQPNLASAEQSQTTDSEDQSSNSVVEDQLSIITTTSSQAGNGAERVLHRRFSSDYFVEASEQFNEAVQLEVNDRFAEALDAYKAGLEVLMTGIRSETDPMRRRLAKEKVEKYLTRSENIYEHFLKPGAAEHSSSVPGRGRELPLNQLAKYKVIRVLDDNVMSVQEVTTRRFFIIKSIDRTSEWDDGLRDESGDLSYMVSLVAYFVAEYVIFLLLQPASGGKIMDYVRTYNARKDQTVQEEEEDEKDEQADEEDNEISAPAYDTMGADVDIDDLLVSSQKLLSSVQRTLDEGRRDSDAERVTETDSEPDLSVSMKMPEACVRQWAKELIVAVDTLHSRKILLGHLTTDNLLLGKSGQVMLTYYHYQDYHKAMPQALDFPGPVDRPQGEKWDWYCVGVILYQLLTGCRFQDLHPGGAWYYFELQLPETSQLSPVAVSLLCGLLDEDPKRRFGFKEVCAHPFFNEATG